MTLLGYFNNLYGDNFINGILKIIFELLFYFASSMFGAIIRELAIEKKRSFVRALVSIMITTAILFTFGTFLKQVISDQRLVFGLSVALGIYFPNFSTSFKNGNFFKAIVGLFSDKLRKVLDECDKNDSKSKKHKK